MNKDNYLIINLLFLNKRSNNLKKTITSNMNKTSQTKKSTQKAVFAEGCFWGVEDLFSKLKGVVSTTVGYAGGHIKNPNYLMVCTGLTGHAESVEVEFDPKVISYQELLNVFWNSHDPTTVNRQGPDYGSQYRSIIFYNNAEQKELAELSKKSLEKSKKFQNPIVTSIEQLEIFYPAEEYHQDYIKKHGGNSCHF